MDASEKETNPYAIRLKPVAQKTNKVGDDNSESTTVREEKNPYAIRLKPVSRSRSTPEGVTLGRNSPGADSKANCQDADNSPKTMEQRLLSENAALKKDREEQTALVARLRRENRDLQAKEAKNASTIHAMKQRVHGDDLQSLGSAFEQAGSLGGSWKKEGGRWSRRGSANFDDMDGSAALVLKGTLTGSDIEAGAATQPSLMTAPLTATPTLSATPSPTSMGKEDDKGACEAAMAVIERFVTKLYLKAQRSTSLLNSDLETMAVDPAKDHTDEEIDFFHETQLPFWIEQCKNFNEILITVIPLHKQLFASCRVAHSIGEVAKGVHDATESEMESVRTMAEKYATKSK